MANLCAAIFVSPSVVVIVCRIHCGPVAFQQAIGRVANDHLRAWIREVDWNVNPQGILSVVGACYSNFNSGVTSRIDPSHTVSAKILLKQLFLVSKPRLLKCWPRHDANTALNASMRATERWALLYWFWFQRKTNVLELNNNKKQPRSQGLLSTSRKYPGYGWSSVC